MMFSLPRHHCTSTVGAQWRWSFCWSSASWWDSDIVLSNQPLALHLHTCFTPVCRCEHEGQTHKRHLRFKVHHCSRWHWDSRARRHVRGGTTENCSVGLFPAWNLPITRLNPPAPSHTHHSTVNKHLLDNKLTCWLSKQGQLYACFYDKELDYGKQHYVVTAADRRPTAGGSEASARLKKIWCLLSENGGLMPRLWWRVGAVWGMVGGGCGEAGGDLKVKGKQIYTHSCILSQYIDTNVYCMLK